MRSDAVLIVASLILASAVVVAGVLVQQSLESAREEITALRGDVQQLARAQPAAARPTRRRGPDPNRRYEISVDGSPIRGPEEAPITIVAFSDFQCPFCNRVNPTLRQIQNEYGDDVRVVFKHLPLSIHPKAPGAHAAAEAAHQQGKFWEMHDAIFQDQAGMSDQRYAQYAERIGLDVERWEQDRSDQKVQGRVQADLQEAERLEVTGTPAFFVNGRFLSGAQPFANFKRLIDQELERQG